MTRRITPQTTLDNLKKEAKRRLTPYNVFLAMDSFGYVCWNENDTGIGQHIEDIAGVAEVISPMLYPSGFQFGIPGYRNPVQNPYEIVFKSLEECKRRTAGLPAPPAVAWLPSPTGTSRSSTSGR